MAASHEAVDQMVTILLKYLSRKDAQKLVREMYQKVKGNQSTMETFRRISERLVEEIKEGEES